MNIVRDIFAGRADIDFRPKWKVTLAFSALLVVLSIGSLAVKQLNPSIDFEGGTIWQIPDVEGVTAESIKEADAQLVDARVQDVFDRSGERVEITVQVGTDVENIPAVRENIAEFLDISADDINEDTVGPTWGDQITGSAIRALIFFFIAVAIYLAWSLEWKMAAAALSAVVHDLLITAGIYSLTGFEVSPATVIALLTILGYSLYDTVVVFDKIKENEANPLLSTSDYSKTVSYSMNQVIMRSINTTITTVLPVLSMLIIGAYFLNAPSISSFALALFIGLLLGTYSSIFFAAPILVWLNQVMPSERQAQELQEKRAQRKGTSARSDKGTGTIAPRARKKSKQGR